MAKSILGCFLFPSCYSQISSNQISSKDLDDFYNSYCEDLNKISNYFARGSLSLNWSVKAMKILKKMQVELLILIKKSNLCISIGTEDGNWFNQYMKDSMTMLDLCNSLKFAVSRVDRYRMMVDIMMNEFNKNDSSKIMEFKSQEYLILHTVKETTGQGEDGSISSAMIALLHSAFVSQVSIKLGGCDLTCKYPQLKPFIKMLSMLVREFNERDSTMENRSGSELIEQEIVAKVIVDIQTQVVDGIEDKEKLLSSLELLRTSSVELKEGIENLDVAVGDVFDVLIRGRNEMLRVLRDRYLSIG
ncbi:hypothetical protein KFK09_001088 [Dendrobium nobile]|uniref:Uncharacterized protein n=1 Tax=Dendrobium nobile TaxID=94219 RepID=A0A8T3C3U2_DENNO|nr:hypothetical protein KFK09_001088 [Dendrobium nobile]